MFHDIKIADYDHAVSEGIITVLPHEWDRKVLDEIESLSIHKGAELDLSISMVYTPLNGAGHIPFTAMLKDIGYTDWHEVKEQALPDPDFTTVGYPNPEDTKAFALSEKLGYVQFGRIDDERIIARFVTSWATTDEQLDELERVL